MRGHSRPKDGVASARLYVAGIHVVIAAKRLDGRVKPGHSEVIA